MCNKFYNMLSASSDRGYWNWWPMVLELVILELDQYYIVNRVSGTSKFETIFVISINITL